MKYLLDVNALIALGFLQHEFHERVAVWVDKAILQGNAGLATCPITELGFARVLTQASQYRLTVSQAGGLLLRLKAENALRFSFIPDDHDISILPKWVKTARQTTDGYLAQLARAHGAVLATLDRSIHRSLLIPG